MLRLAPYIIIVLFLLPFHATSTQLTEAQEILDSLATEIIRLGREQDRINQVLEHIIGGPQVSGEITFFVQGLYPLLGQLTLPTGEAIDGLVPSVRQLARVHLRQSIQPHTDLYLSLDHLGIWGIGPYSTASYGVHHRLTDPLSVQAFYLEHRLAWGTLRLGQQYPFLGGLGLLTSHRPISDLLSSPIGSITLSTPQMSWVLGRPSATYAPHGPFLMEADTWLAGRMGRENLGLTLLLSGAEESRGISLDWAWQKQFGGFTSEIATLSTPTGWSFGGVTRIHGQWPAVRSEVWLAYLQQGFNPLLTALESHGGPIPFRTGQQGVLGQIWLGEPQLELGAEAGLTQTPDGLQSRQALLLGGSHENLRWQAAIRRRSSVELTLLALETRITYAF